MGTPIPLWLLRDLKCRHCRNFVSCGPVYVTPDCGLLCGRCKMLAKPNFRNYVYEELVNIFRFPCQYWENHCPEEGRWNSLKEHEINCQYGSTCGLICVDPLSLFKLKRVLPNEESLLYLEVPAKCLNLVCCKNCGKYLSCEPVHINILGSNICHRCYLSNGAPPNTLRNLGYEKIANIFRFSCIFRAKGCPMKSKFGRDSWEHEVHCHYKDVKIPLTPSTSFDEGRRISDVDNSGYRLSYENESMVVRKCSSHNETPFELPRLTTILSDQVIAKEIRKSQQDVRRSQQDIELEEQPFGQTELKKAQSSSSSPDSFVYDVKEYHDYSLKEDRIPEKERGIVQTHSGHVYATLTKTSALFAPPKMQRNTDPSNGKVTREFQDKLKRNASNASQSEYNYRERTNNSVVSEWKVSPSDQEIINDNSSDVIHSADSNSFHSLDSPTVNRSLFRNQDRSGEEVSPVVKEYVQYNPQNNVQRNESMTIGNAGLIAELKMRNQQRRKNRQQNESSNGIEVH